MTTTNHVTDEMLTAAMKKAVELGIIPKYAIGEEEYIKRWEGLKAVLSAALSAS